MCRIHYVTVYIVHPHRITHGAMLSTCFAFAHLCSCNRCKQLITSSFVATHACASASFFPTEKLCQGSRCVLCNKPAAVGKKHSCTSSALTHVFYDLSDLHKSDTWEKEPLAFLRDRPGHWVIVFSLPGPLSPKHDDVYRHHCYVATSGIKNSGLGLFTVTGTTNEACDNSIPCGGSTRRAAGPPQGRAWVPCLTKQMIGIYTGLPCKTKKISATGTQLQERIAMIMVG